MKIEVKKVNLSKIKLNPDNPRQINKTQLDRLVKSITEFPEMMELREIVVDDTMTILGGNMRFRALKEAGAKEAVAKIVTGLTPEQKREFIIKDNGTNWGEWDMDALGNLWSDLPLTEWGIDLPEDWMNEGGGAGLTDPDEIPEVPKVAITKPGDIWLLGKHRLLCGDSTDPEAVARLMDGQKADMCFTDPPYGVDYSGENKTMYYGKNKKGKPTKKIKGDKTTEKYKEFLPVVKSFLSGPLYMFCGAGYEFDVLTEIKKNDIEIINTMVWNKDRFGGHVMGANYKPCFEMFYYLLPKNNKRGWSGPNNEETLWTIKRGTVNEYHPTQKPVELAERAINNHDAVSVLDLFGGSGSTLIAAEQTGRTAFLMELDPLYVDVTVQRWEQFTGEKATLEER